MNNLIIYSIEIAISLALFYSAYWVFLKNETFFKLNRFYLVASVAISLLMPLLDIKLATTIGEDTFITKYLVLPIEQYEQSITGDIATENIYIKNKRTTPEGIDMVSRKEESLNQTTSAQSDPAQVLPLNSEERNNPGKKTTWLTLVLIIYCIGAALFLIRFVANFIWIFGYALRHRTQQISGMKVIKLEKSVSPFSFLNFIFIGHEEYEEAELTKIISHEKIHIQQKHSIDLILLEALLIFQWFNPFVWLYKRALKITHEYLADQGALNSGVDLPGYQYSLLNQVLRKNNFEIASNYNLSIKKRIAMMMKKRSSKLATLKLTAVLPILIILFSAFAFKTNASKKEVNPNEKNSLIVESDSSIKRVNVSMEYLKLLEGDYISTNEPSQVRKIKFAVVLDELLGNDNGYVYRIIPVGDGKFINPDDKASFVFDTKDKNAITLLLFGKITLKKVKVTRKSIAFSLVDVITKDGIPAALSRYKSLKDSGNYYFQENETNFAGYKLLQAGKTKEAAAIFKLNVEAYPNSFNVYDSYGEALMALGDKAQAVEMYKRSVQLNPGSASGIKVLKEAGINTDTLIKKVSVEYLKLLEGEYISTNEPNFVRKIRFTEQEGVLTGNDNGYKYKLVPVGDGKFINPDDGASLVFDTKDKNAISLLLFGRVHLKKLKASEGSGVNTGPVKKANSTIKKVNVPVESLMLLEGQYVSTNEPNRVRRITFVVINGELVGDDNGYVYKLIPVGDGKFINPDDDASLVFDMKEKSAITLLLFGRINLKKVN